MIRIILHSKQIRVTKITKNHKNHQTKIKQSPVHKHASVMYIRSSNSKCVPFPAIRAGRQSDSRPNYTSTWHDVSAARLSSRRLLHAPVTKFQLWFHICSIFFSRFRMPNTITDTMMTYDHSDFFLEWMICRRREQFRSRDGAG